MTHILPDLLAPNLKLVFCGTAASIVSAREAAYYANPTNYFWRMLYKVGLTPRQFKPQEFPALLKLGIGLTDLAKSAKGNDADLLKTDFDVTSFYAKIERYQPKMIAFTSKKAASVALQTTTGKIAYGLHADKIASSSIWVLPSPSGSGRRYWDESYWELLAQNVARM